MERCSVSPRNSLFFYIIFLFVFVFALDGIAKEDNIFINFYQTHISAIDGNRCPMTPSCSQYASQAFKKHGPALGWIMTCDRLMRCGRDELKISPVKVVNGQKFTHDPLSINDFWWFNPNKNE
ncbi:MAG: membrane protein insertion efficiency factor YidD [Desulfobacteraceae bacterium]|nr:membrane protein insertion efficiency factor YidD [Desulfobacteraceae bacterium]